jgi:hypothetical protein
MLRCWEERINRNWSSRKVSSSSSAAMILSASNTKNSPPFWCGWYLCLSAWHRWRGRGGGGDGYDNDFCNGLPTSQNNGFSFWARGAQGQPHFGNGQQTQRGSNWRAQRGPGVFDMSDHNKRDRMTRRQWIETLCMVTGSFAFRLTQPSAMRPHTITASKSCTRSRFFRLHCSKHSQPTPSRHPIIARTWTPRRIPAFIGRRTQWYLRTVINFWAESRTSNGLLIASLQPTTFTNLYSWLEVFPQYKLFCCPQ